MNKQWTDKERHELYRDCIATWGASAQVDMLIEELGELVVATQKYFRRGRTDDRLADLASEIADVMIMTEEIVVLIGDEMKQAGDSPDDHGMRRLVAAEIQRKLERTAERVALIKTPHETGVA